MPAGLLLACSLAYAGALTSAQYAVSDMVLVNGSANTVSANYKIRTGTLGQTVSGTAQSSNYINSGGFVTPVTVVPLPANLDDAYVYPNPFKPNSPGRFQAAKITFKHLPAEATIKIFGITGVLVAELHKTDRAVDYLEWDVRNSGGQKLASGVYIYYMTAPGSGKARGKFAVIR
ncbi:MAG TPA: hypothetical protein DCZ92_01280 [Elusimicrobia bacterium]|nr:MAG: hypothetical protein A2016_00195 [Elusimicrobia bacterium GWF2_62_30]HBA59459.1 hypothetical protein [Elusimicrobiota bacterium]